MPVRIYDIAKKLGLENKEVLIKAKALGIAAKVPSSLLDSITAEYLEQRIVESHPQLRAKLTAAQSVVPAIAVRAAPNPPSASSLRAAAASSPAPGEGNVVTKNAMIRTNYIFVDYENVQQLDLDLIAGKPVKVIIIVGARQKSLPYALTKQIHKYHSQVQLIESEGASRNALDLVLAYNVGLQAQADPKGHFHVLSKDRDYEALIKHLRSHEIRACRVDVFANIPAMVDLRHLMLKERVQWVVERLAKNKASRPQRKKTLLATIAAICRKELSEAEVQQIVDAMVASKLIQLTPHGVVSYTI